MNRPIEDEIEAVETAKALWNTIRATTTELEFQVLLHALIAGRQLVQIADELNKSLQIVSAAQNRAVRKVRAVMEV